MCFCFKNYLLVEVTCLLFRCNETKFFLWNPNNTDRNGVNKQNKQTPKTQRKMTLEMVSYYENKWYPPFLKYPPILPTPSLLWEKIWTRPFSKTFLAGESNYEPGCFWISVFFSNSENDPSNNAITFFELEIYHYTEINTVAEILTIFIEANTRIKEVQIGDHESKKKILSMTQPFFWDILLDLPKTGHMVWS